MAIRIMPTTLRWGGGKCWGWKDGRPIGKREPVDARITCVNPSEEELSATHNALGKMMVAWEIEHKGRVTKWDAYCVSYSVSDVNEWQLTIDLLSPNSPDPKPKWLQDLDRYYESFGEIW